MVPEVLVLTLPLALNCSCGTARTVVMRSVQPGTTPEVVALGAGRYGSRRRARTWYWRRIGSGRVVVDEVELENGVTAQAVVPLGIQAALLAVVVVVLRAIVPDVGGLIVGLLVVALRAVEAEGVFRVERVDGDGEVFDGAAEDGEFLHVGAVEESVVAAGFAERDLLGEPRGGAGGEAVAHAALLFSSRAGSGS